MNSPTTVSTRLLAAILWMGFSLLQAADPAPTAPAPKPRFAPRPVPGMFTSPPRPTSQISRPVTAPTATGYTASATVSGTEQARIVAIYRRGTFTLPPDAPVPVTSLAIPQAPAKPATTPALRPGQIRIMTQAEAAQLVAQPKP